MKNAAILWTGGKDSSLALYEAKLSGYKIRGLVTFIPSEPEFHAHPLGFMRYQAEALGLPHHTLSVEEPFKESYQNAICSLRQKYGIDTLITGDIAEVDGYPNWIRECSEYSGVDVLTPLWGFNRHELINKLLSYKFKVIFSYVKKPWFTNDSLLGERLNKESLEQLCTISTKTGLDLCGENGEYHTIVVDGPLFRKKIEILKSRKVKMDGYWFLDITDQS